MACISVRLIFLASSRPSKALIPRSSPRVTALAHRAKIAPCEPQRRPLADRHDVVHLLRQATTAHHAADGVRLQEGGTQRPPMLVVTPLSWARTLAVVGAVTLKLVARLAESTEDWRFSGHGEVSPVGCV